MQMKTVTVMSFEVLETDALGKTLEDIRTMILPRRTRVQRINSVFGFGGMHFLFQVVSPGEFNEKYFCIPARLISAFIVGSE